MRRRRLEMICDRLTMLRCRRSRRRSRKRYLSRTSSGYSGSPNTGSGSSRAVESAPPPHGRTPRCGRSAALVDGLGGARLHQPVDPDHPFRPHGLDELERRRIGIADALGDAVMVAKVDEEQAAVIAHAMHPARQTQRTGRRRPLRALRRYGNDRECMGDNLGSMCVATARAGRLSNGPPRLSSMGLPAAPRHLI